MDVVSNVSLCFDSATEAFEQWYDILKSQNNVKESRDGDVVGEVINAITLITDPRDSLVRSEIRGDISRYAIGEAIWYLSGSNKLREIQKYSKGWDRISDDGETVNSNYGWCIKHKFGFDQYEYVKEMLRKDSSTRQAVIHIKSPDLTKSKDVNCTVCLQFFIRDNKLYMTTYMRSNDLWMGFPYDVFNFCNLQVLLSMELGVELGTYTHIAGSLHLYKRNVK